MYCKYCAQKLNDKTVTKCPSCGSKINIYDHGQSFFEDHELDAWHDDSPAGGFKTTEMVLPVAGSSKRSLPNSLVGAAMIKDDNYASMGGAKGFFSKYKIAIIACSIAAVLVIAAVIMLVSFISKFANKEDADTDNPVTDVQSDTGTNVTTKAVSEVLSDIDAKFIGIDSDITGKFIQYQITAKGEVYDVKAYIGDTALHYKKSMEDIWEKDGFDGIKTPFESKYDNTLNRDELYCNINEFKLFLVHIGALESETNEHPTPENTGSEQGNQPENQNSPQTVPGNGDSEPEQKEELVSLQEFLMNNGFKTTANRIEFYRFDSGDSGPSLNVSLTKDGSTYCFSYKDGPNTIVPPIHMNFPKDYEWKQGENGYDVFLSMDDCQKILKDIESIKNK